MAKSVGGGLSFVGLDSAKCNKIERQGVAAMDSPGLAKRLVPGTGTSLVTSPSLWSLRPVSADQE